MSAPYAGATVSPTFLQRWRSGNHVGNAIPVVKVEYRRGEFRRRYHNGSEWKGNAAALFGEIAGGNGKFWYADWFPLSSWKVIDQVMDCKIDQSFDKNGVATATIVVDNTILQSATGVAGLFHQIQQGWWTPLRGYSVQGQPKPLQPKNSNFQQLPNAQIRVWFGYGPDQLVQSFIGLIDSLDIEGGTGSGGGGQGAQVTINARDFGGTLLDEHIYNWNVDRMIHDPVTFVPRNLAENTYFVGGGATASSEASGHPARLVSDSNQGTAWESADRSGSNQTEWIEIAIPDGLYNAIYVYPELASQDLYVSIYARVRHRGSQLVPCRFEADNNQLHAQTIDQSVMQQVSYIKDPYSHLMFAQGWVDLWKGRNMVPGANGGIPYARVVRGTEAGKGVTIHFGGTYFLGGNTKIRISVRNLGQVHNRPKRYRAGIGRLSAVKQVENAQAKAAHWVIVGDVAEIVECCLRWAGFKTWEIETTGVDLKTPYVTGKAKTYMDVINDVKKQTGFVFFVAEPKTTSDSDLGTPIFRTNRILSPRQQTLVEKITDDKLLIGSRINYTNQNERIIIRVRGQMLSRKQGGRYLNGDANSRAMYVYYPPWTNRMAGVIKHFTHYDPNYLSNTDCQFACYLIGLQIALADVTATVSTALTPHIGLDSYFLSVDRASGTQSRIYVTNRILQFTAGEQAKFISTFGGSMMDTPDVQTIMKSYRTAAKTADRNDGPHRTNPPKRRPPHKHVKTLTL